MNQLSGYYNPSGKVEPEGLVKLAAYGVIGTIFASVIASYISYFVSTNIHSLVAIAAWTLLGFFIGYFVSLGAELGKIRNRVILTASGFLLGVLGVYVSIVTSIMIADGYQAVVFNPAAMVSYINRISITGLIFLLVFLAIPTWRGFRFLKKRPFCESCNVWVDKKESIYPFPMIDDPEQKEILVDTLENGGFEVLEKLKLSPSIMTDVNKYFTQIDVEYCSTCGQFYLLSISNREIVWIQGSKGENYQKETIHPLIEQIIIPRKVYKTIRGIDYTEKPMDVDAMIGEVSWAHRAKNTLRKMFID